MIQKVLFLALFLLLLLSLLLFLSRAAGIWQNIWPMYYRIYLLLALFHIWYVMILLIWEDVQKKNYPKYADEKIAVIVPCYNEDPELLKRAILSICEAKGNKQIIIVDDGSAYSIRRMITPLNTANNIFVRSFRKNHGKRKALHTAVKELIGICKFVVTVDSDTILDRDALVRIIEPLKQQNIGAASGNIQLLNERQNVLTRMTGAYYWIALHIHRRAQSALGMVSCCSGALAAYRSDVLKNIIDDFLKEQFLGKRCTHSEDRHLTNLVLKCGYDVVFISNAVAYTYAPSTYRLFLKQQIRWRRGFLREMIFALPFMWRKKPVLFIEILLWEFLMPFLSFGLVLLIVMNIFFNPLFFTVSVAISLFLLMFIRYMPIIFYSPSRIGALFYFMLFSHFIIYWQTVYALFTLRDEKWITR
jgi:hyaluronan synthase